MEVDGGDGMRCASSVRSGWGGVTEVASRLWSGECVMERREEREIARKKRLEKRGSVATK